MASSGIYQSTLDIKDDNYWDARTDRPNVFYIQSISIGIEHNEIMLIFAHFLVIQSYK